MAYSELFRRYVDGRVLVESARVVSPSIPGMAVWLEPAHIEMLRNIVQYCNRRDTFVSSYSDVGYMVPDDSDWDSILSSVADLEYILMGQDNVLFGINEDWNIAFSEFASSAGSYTNELTALSSGYYYVLQNAHFANFTRDVGTTYISIARDSQSMYVAMKNGTSQYDGITHDGDMVLAPGDVIKFYCNGVEMSDSLRGHVIGYKIKV